MQPSPAHDAVMNSLFDGVYYVDFERRITFWNNAAERISGYSREEVLGSSCSDGILRHIDEKGTDLCRQGCPLRASMQDGEHREMEVFLHHREGHRVPVVVRAAPLYGGDGAIVGAVEVFSEATARRRVLREIQELRREAYLDGRTGLGNRRYADLALEARFRERREYGIDFGVLMAGVGGLDAVRQTYGPQDADRALRMTARSLLASCRELDVVCRLGGGNFLVVVPNAAPDALAAIGSRMRTFVANSWFLREGREVRVSLSVGGAVVRPGDDPAAIMRRAQQCMVAGREQAAQDCPVA